MNVNCNAFNVYGNENTSCIYSPGDDNKIILKFPYLNLCLISIISNDNNTIYFPVTGEKIFNFIVISYVFKYQTFKEYHMEATTYNKSTYYKCITNTSIE